MDLTLKEKICYTTLRIEAFLPDGLISTGTGFLFLFQFNGKPAVPCLVTNKHVIEGSKTCRIVISYTQADGSTGREKIVFESNLWIKHPEDTIDLCVFPINQILNGLRSQGKRLINVFLEESLIPSPSQVTDFSPIEEITMIGYPDGIWDEVNNFPIVRRGITATQPTVDFNGKALFLIDAACFPGSSGSPVLILNYGSFVDKKGDLMLGNRVYLLGVLYAGPQHAAKGDISFSYPNIYTRIPNNLGMVIKSSKLLDFRPALGLN